VRALFSVDRLTVGYGSKVVVKDVSFTIQAGEFTVLLGLNGSGKTTLLKAMCGLIKPISGRVMVHEQDILAMKERERARYLSYIPQRHSELKGISVLDVVLMGINPQLGMFMRPNACHKALAQDILAKADLSNLAEDDFSEISEGQKQMVILSRILMQNALVLLMDEPDSSLDYLNKHKMLKDTIHLIKTEAKAGIMTLHDPNLALAYADRLLMIKNGSIIHDLQVKETGRMKEAFYDIYGEIKIWTFQL